MYDSMSAEVEVLDFLKSMVNTVKPELVVETGTFSGLSTLRIAEGLQANGVGKVITCEWDKKVYEAAKKRFAESGLGNWIDARNESSLEMKIDGQNVVEVDVSAAQLSALLGPKRPEGDLYQRGRLAQVPRPIVKTWVTVSIGDGSWLGHGTIVQLVEASLRTFMASGTRGRRSRLMSSGSTSSSACGATGPDIEIRAARCSPSARTRSPTHGGT